VTKTKRIKHENTDWQKPVRHLLWVEGDYVECRCHWVGTLKEAARHMANASVSGQ
jgi:hypothetical protein